MSSTEFSSTLAFDLHFVSQQGMDVTIEAGCTWDLGLSMKQGLHTSVTKTHYIMQMSKKKVN